jgi:hypothetical protein
MDELKILDYFHELKKEENPILIWTKIEGGPERKLFFCHVHHSNLVDLEIGFINNDPKQQFKKYCSQKAEVFVYSEKDSMLLKTTIKRFHEGLLIVHFPQKINIVADDLKLNIHKTIEALSPSNKNSQKLDENSVESPPVANPPVEEVPELLLDEHGIEVETAEDQAKYAKLRAAPRGKADKGQHAKVQITSSNGEDTTSNHDVFDISRGGISLLSTAPNIFKKGDGVVILTINDDEPPFSLEGSVVSIKRIDLKNIKYRIGIKFKE